MDPLSVIASIVGISTATVQLITQLSAFVDDVKNGSNEVQALSNELASFYAILGHIKLILTRPRNEQIPAGFLSDFQRMIRANEATLKELQKIIDNAKEADSDRSSSRVWKTVRYTFKTKQIEALRKHIQAENEVLGKMILVLADNRGERIETKLQLLDEIHANVKSLARQNIKEVLVVLEREDESDPQQRGEFILRDRTSRGNQGANIPSGPTLEPHGQNATPSGNGGADNDVPPLEDQFLNWTNSDASKAAFAGAASHLAEHFRKQRLGIGDGFAFEDQIARASFKLTIEEEQSLLLARTKTWKIKTASGGSVKNPGDMGSIYQDPAEEGRKSLEAHIDLRRLILLTIKNEKQDVCQTAEFRKFRSGVTFHKTMVEDNTVSITCSKDWENSSRIPYFERLERSGGCWDLKYTFERSEDAKEMGECLIHLQTLWMKVWELHTVAFAQIAPSLKIHDPEKLRHSTIAEICKHEFSFHKEFGTTISSFGTAFQRWMVGASTQN